MLLNADIIFDNLPEHLKASILGPKNMDLHLSRPELYEGSEKPFLANRLYFVQAERLPQRAHAERGCVILCLGTSSKLQRYTQRCCVITIDKDTDFYEAFNAVQHIFDLYDAWENDLNRIVDEDANITHMLNRSEEVFQNPIYALGDDFKILGASSKAAQLAPETTFESADGTALRLGAFDQFLEMHDLSMDERDPLVINLLDQTTLNYNLIENDIYHGCVTVHYVGRNYRPSDKPVVAHLGQLLLRALHRLSGAASEGRGSVRQAVQSLVEGIPLDAVTRNALERASEAKTFICLRLKLSNRLDQLPLGYVRNMVESAFQRSMVFEYHRNSIVAFIDTETLNTPDFLEAIRIGIEPFTSTMSMQAGVSDVLHDLLQARLYFLQADMALSAGSLFDPNESIYVYQDYVLREMIIGAMGDMPLELLSPEGLRRLIEHDASSQTSYVDTLRSYLNNNMNVAQTSKELFVHRSTLLERLSRIKRDLGLDLDDPDVQLRLRILLKAMQVREQLLGE